MGYELTKYGHGIIALLPVRRRHRAILARAGDANGAAASLAEFKDIFGAENVFLEITHTTRVLSHEALMKKIIALARQSGTSCRTARRVAIPQTR